MKMRQPHVVPLASQNVAIPRDLHLVTGRGRYVEVRAAYNRAQRLPERRTMMEAWADYVKRMRVSRTIDNPQVDPRAHLDSDVGPYSGRVHSAVGSREE